MDDSQPDAGPPRDFEALRNRILERHGAMPKRLAQVARHALDHPDRMALSTVAELAEAASVQPSTLVRFAQSLGYSGFSELQSVFRAQLRDRWPDYRERLARVKDESGTEPARILDRFIDTAARSVADLGRTIVPGEFDAAATLLARAAHVYILGQRRAFPVASYLAYALGKLDFPAILLDNVGSMADVQAGRIGPADTLIAISFNPYTPSTIDLVRFAAQRGAAIVAITDSVFSPVSAEARARLEVVEADHGAFRSLSATMALAMALAIASAEVRDAG
ncbi:MAG TPA: MurR/RpiR family transcriptional regulator [Acidiphilium sp.]